MTTVGILRSGRLVRFGPYEGRVEFDDCDDLLAAFRSILRGWDVAEVERDENAGSPVIRFRKRNGWFHWRSRRLPPPKGWSPHGPRKVMDAVADFHYRFLDWHAQEFTDQFCLHCAAVEMGGGLVIFPSVKKAGKSTLVTELPMRGFRVFCDDVLPVDPRTGQGLALGILPRIRLPVPSSLSARHRAFIDARLGISDRFAAYIELREGELADFGAAAPIRAIVLLRRQPDPVAARLSATGRAEALARLIDQNFALHLSPTWIFDGMLSIVERASLHELTFSDTDEAAGLLATAFGD